MKATIKHTLPTQRRIAAVDVFEQCCVISVYHNNRVLRKCATADEVAALFAADGDDAARPMRLSAALVAVAPAAGGRMRLWALRKNKKTSLRLRIGRRNRTLTVWPGTLLIRMTWDRSGLVCIERVWRLAGRLRKNAALYCPALPNVYGDGRICWGDIDVAAAAAGIADPVAAFEAAFFGTLFSDHLLDAALIDTAPWANTYAALTATGGRVPVKYLKKAGVYDG